MIKKRVLSRGGVREPTLRELMMRYNAAKRLLRAAEKAKDKKAGRAAIALMKYHETGMLAAGAVDLNMCSKPSQFLWDNWSPKRRVEYNDKKARAIKWIAAAKRRAAKKKAGR